MDFDIRTKDAAWYFALGMLGMTGDQLIHSYILDYNKDFEAFWRIQKAHLDSVNIEPLRIMAFHVTGSIDDCSCYKQHGLLNLQQALSTNTPVKRMLDKYNLHIDLRARTMEYHGTVVDVDYERFRHRCFVNEREEIVESVARRLFYDYCANGFLMNDNIYRYGTGIHQRPEFILDLVKLYPELQEMECEWINQHKSYRLDFFAYMDQIERFTFSLDEYRDPPFEDWREMSDEQKMKKWMLAYALDRAFDELIGEEFLYIRNDSSIPPEQIISYTEIPGSQPDNFRW